MILFYMTIAGLLGFLLFGIIGLVFGISMVTKNRMKIKELEDKINIKRE